jgi:hypothetical protein
MDDARPVTVALVAEPPRRKHRRLLLLALVPAAITVGVNVRRVRGRRALQHEPADVGFMYAMHNAMRRDLTRLEASVAAMPEGPYSEGLEAGFEVFRKELMSHHEAEDTDLWRVLRAHLDDRADLAVLDDASEADAAAVMAEVPPPGRVVIRRVLQPRYAKRQLWENVAS